MDYLASGDGHNNVIIIDIDIVFPVSLVSRLVGHTAPLMAPLPKTTSILLTSSVFVQDYSTLQQLYDDIIYEQPLIP